MNEEAASPDFRTNDLTLASTLVASGFTPNTTDRHRDGRVDFIFPRKDGLDPLVEGYWKREVRVDPIDFSNAQRYLKSRLYNHE